MTSVGYSTLDVIPSVKNLRAQLEAQTGRDFDAAGRKGGERFGDAAGKAAGGRFKTRFGSVAKDAFAPIAGIIAGAGIVSMFKDAVAGASDLAESGNKVKVIFGDATGQVDKFASQGAKALGQTKLEVLDAASSFGVFGKAAGLSGGDLADFSTKLAGLSTDLASFFNTDPSQAVEAIGAGLRGESEPLRQFGVLLDDATLRQEALRQGLVQTTKQALTPQQRVLAAYQVILRQTTDAQGDFQRTSGGLANQQRILSAQWSEMKTELGSKLLPAVTATVRAFNDGVIPATEKAGGAVGDAVGWFSQLPAPVKAATGALVAFKTAQALGVGNSLSSGLGTLSKGFEDIRLRAMLAATEYQNLRTATLNTTASAHVFTPAVGRMSAALGALKAGATGAGAGLKRGLSGALSLVGGPWGVAFITGTAVLTHFWQEHQKAKARVEDLTASLDKQTGKITTNSREKAIAALQDAGAFKAARELGLSLGTLTDAYLGVDGASEKVAAHLAAVRASLQNVGAAAGANDTGMANLGLAMGTVNDVLGQGNSELAKSKQAWRDQAEAMKTSAAASSTATSATATYTDDLKKARDAVRALRDEENKRRNANLGAFQDETRLAQAFRDANKEAADGARTLDKSKEAGLANRDALGALADAWNSSSDKVKNAKGAYSDMRNQFIKVAEKMGATKTEAQKLADQLLNLPRKVPIEYQSKGYKAALRDLKYLKEYASERIIITAQAVKNRADLADIRGHATGGLITGPGTGTSDSILMRGSNGEFMQRKAAVDYYGVDFMRRLNALQVPRYATGGPIGPAPLAASAPLGSQVAGELRLVGSTAYITGVARSVEEDRLRAQRRAQLEGRRA